MKSEMYHEQYRFEWERKEQLQSQLNVHIAALVIVGGAIVSMIHNYPYSKAHVTSLFVVFSVCAVASVAFSSFFCFLSFFGHKYGRVGRPSKYQSYFSELKEWYQEEKPEATEEEIESDYQQFYLMRLDEAIEQNFVVNGKRASHLNTATIWIGVAFLCAVICSIPYTLQSIKTEWPIHNVKIIEFPPQSPSP